MDISTGHMVLVITLKRICPLNSTYCYNGALYILGVYGRSSEQQEPIGQRMGSAMRVRGGTLCGERRKKGE